MEAIQLAREGDFGILLEHIYGQSVDIMGLKRTGKSNTGFVFMEGWLDAGHPLTFIDPHNEGWGLKVTSKGETSPYQILVAGRGKRADIPLNVEHAADLAEFSYKNRISVVLSLLRIPQAERFAIINAYFGRLFALAEQAYEDEEVSNYGIALEEAPTYLPQIGTTPVKPILKQIVQEGGKFGFTTFLITQRSQDLDKSILSQAETYILHHVMHPRDKEVYRGIIPEPGEKVEQRIASLKNQGDAIVVHRGKVHLIQVKPQATYHVGSTPGVSSRAILPISSLDTAMLDQLRALMTSVPPDDPVQQQVKHFQQQIQNLETAMSESNQQHEEVIKAKDAEIQELRSQLNIARMVRQVLDESGLLRGEASPALIRLDSLSTSVERATIDVAQLLDIGIQSGPLAGEGVHPVSFDAFVRRMQQLEEDNASLRGELGRLYEKVTGKEMPIEQVQEVLSRDFHAAQVNFEQAHIQQFYAGAEVAVQGGDRPFPEETGALPVAVLPAEFTVDLMEQLLYSEKKLLKKLLGQIGDLSSIEKALFTWLLEHDGQEVSSQQLAESVSMDVRVTWTGVTRKLVKIPFISRWEEKKFWFKADFAAYARRNFASASDPKAIVQQLVEAAQE